MDDEPGVTGDRTDGAPDDDRDAALQAAAEVLQQAIVQNGGTPSELAVDWVRDILRAAGHQPYSTVFNED